MLTSRSFASDWEPPSADQARAALLGHSRAEHANNSHGGRGAFSSFCLAAVSDDVSRGVPCDGGRRCEGGDAVQRHSRLCGALLVW
jgi:hypothetical protein